MRFTLGLSEKDYEIVAHSEDGERFKIVANGEQFDTRIEGRTDEHFQIVVGHKNYTVKLDSVGGNGEVEAYVNGKVFRLRGASILRKTLSDLHRLESPVSQTELAVAQEGRNLVPGAVVAPMHGTVVSIHKEVGEPVKAEDTLLTVEAMKMENEIKSPQDGKLIELRVTVGKSIEAQQVLAVVR